MLNKKIIIKSNLSVSIVDIKSNIRITANSRNDAFFIYLDDASCTSKTYSRLHIRSLLSENSLEQYNRNISKNEDKFFEFTNTIIEKWIEKYMEFYTNEENFLNMRDFFKTELEEALNEK